MRSLRIALKIYLLLGVALLAGGIASTYLMIRCVAVSASYTAIIQGEIAQAQQVRVLQVTFKKQVQAWKDILLRGKDDAALSKYGTEFHKLAEQVQSGSVTLGSQIQDPLARADLEKFTREHALLNTQYESGLAAFQGNRDYIQADTALKGKDRGPTDTLDQVADRLTGLAEARPVEESAHLRREQRFLIAVLILIWLALAALSVVFARSIGLRLGSCVLLVRAIASGDLTVAAKADGRSDEIGLLIQDMMQMRDQLRQMVASIQSVAGGLSSNAEEVSTSSSRIARSAAEQRDQASQVAAALEQMSASVREVAQHCHGAVENAVRTGQLADGSCHSVEAVAGEVRELATAARHNAQEVLQLGERSRQIGQVVTLIQEIASQTNLLALNAAIESARAGEHGRGFAVVAGEVRRLAERTTAATREIAEAVQSIQQGTSEAVDGIRTSSERVEKSVATADAAAQSLSVLGASAAQVRQRIEQIAQASEEQSQATASVGESMHQTSASIDASAEGAEEAARTAEELVSLAHQLQDQVSQFKTCADAGQPLQIVRKRAA
jgi:methyl-accepting chemotaxis protein